MKVTHNESSQPQSTQLRNRTYKRAFRYHLHFLSEEKFLKVSVEIVM